LPDVSISKGNFNETRSKPFSINIRAALKNARGRFRRGLYNSCDDVDVPLICPTCQLRDLSIEGS